MDGAVLCTQSSQTVGSLQGLSVILPCYKENPMIVATLYTELTAQGAEVIVVDDGNSMDMPGNMPYITYPAHVGYGYALKQGIKKASNPIVCTADSDGQHQMKDIINLYSVYKTISDCKMVVGQRWNVNEKPIRWIGRKCLNFLASLISSHYHPDLNSGLRVFDRDMAIGYSPILCDTFSFTTSLTMSVVTDGHKTCTIPIDVKPRVSGKSHVRLARDGFVTLYYILFIGLALRTRKLREWLRNHIG